MADGDEQPVVPLKVFYSYSHEDAAFRKKLADQLEPFREKGLIEDWFDDRIVPGSDFNEVIRAKMDESDLIVLLVTAAFLNSSYIKEFELPRAYELEKSGRAVLLPILLRPVADWRNIPLFASRQSPLSGDAAVAKRRDKDTAFAKIAEGIARAAEDRRSKRPSTPPVVVKSPVTAPAFRVKFLYAPVETRLYDEIDRNPYKGSHDPDEPAEDSRVQAFLWLPPRAALRGELAKFTTVAVVCDPGLAEITTTGPGLEAEKTPLEGHAKKLLKARFATGSYGVTALSPTDPGYFSRHAARFVQWAAHRFFNDGNEDWLEKFRIAFETTEGLPGGSPSS